MLIFSISFLTAMCSLLYLSSSDLIWAIIPAVVIAISILNRKRLNHVVVFVLTGFCAGFILAVTSAAVSVNHKLTYIPEKEISITGIITDLPVESVSQMQGKQGKRVRFSFSVNYLNIDIPLRKILLNWYEFDKKPKPGQKWEFIVKLKPIHGFRNPGSFDYAKWLFYKGYDATGTVKSAKLLNQESTKLMSHIDVYRLKIAEFIESNISDDRIASLVRALTIGDKSQISFEDRQLFQNTGTSHLIAISGLHVGLIAFIGIFLGRLLFWIFPSQRVNRFVYESFFAILFAGFYSLLAGFSIPTIRALVMVTVFSLSYVLKLNVTRWNSWAMALLIVMIIQPFSVLDPGFWFSFFAVAVLMFGYSGRKRYKSRLTAFVIAQLFILIGLLPLMVLVFGKINLLTPIANLIILPLASLILIPLIFVSLFVSVFSDYMSHLCFSLLQDTVRIFFWTLDQLNHIDFLSITVPVLSTLSVISLLLMSITIMLPGIFRWKYLALLMLLPLWFQRTDNQISDSEFTVNILDVGQGLSVIIRTVDYTMVYDTGSKYESGFSLANNVVIPFINYERIKTIDKLILSHKDNDHAGGADDIKKQFPQMLTYDVENQVNSCTVPLTWIWNSVRFEILSPFETYPYLGNNSSCVIKISSKYGSVLLTGDIEEPVEYRLVHQFKNKIASDVLLVPHHGSRTSSSADFVQTVNPVIAVNSSGYANQFNHPHPFIKQLYYELGISFYDTQESGMIELNFLKQGISLKQFNKQHKHIWNIH